MKDNCLPHFRSIETRKGVYFVNWSIDALTKLINEEHIRVPDFRFTCDQQCTEFARELFLLALKDSLAHNRESPLADFARGLIDNNIH